MLVELGLVHVMSWGGAEGTDWPEFEEAQSGLWVGKCFFGCVCKLVGGKVRKMWNCSEGMGMKIEQMRDREQKTKKHKMKTKHWRTEVLTKK